MEDKVHEVFPLLVWLTEILRLSNSYLSKNHSRLSVESLFIIILLTTIV